MNFKINKNIIFGALVLFVGFFGLTNALHAEEVKIYDAKVLEVLDEGQIEIIEGFKSDIQTLEVFIKDGPDAGKTIEIENDFIQLKKGDLFYLTDGLNEGEYKVYGVNRTRIIIFFSVIFLILIFMFGGLQGLRGLMSLAGSLFLIIYFLLPNILKGYSPVLISIAASSLIIILGSYITHGFNRTTSSAVIGMVITVVITGVMSNIAVVAARLNGLADEEAFFLSISSSGGIDPMGLLLGGIIIGLLGVLYDIAISQAVSVEELLRMKPDADRTFVYKRAIRMGREHIGALVNTLAIAYVGASLPLFLLFFGRNTVPFMVNINNEIFAGEIIRTIVGSIGLILAVPITTWIAVQMLYGKELPKTSEHSHFH